MKHATIYRKMWERGKGWGYADPLNTLDNPTDDEIQEELQWWTFENDEEFQDIFHCELLMRHHYRDDNYYYFKKKDFQFSAIIWDDDDKNYHEEVNNGCWLSEGYQIWGKQK